MKKMHIHTPKVLQKICLAQYMRNMVQSPHIPGISMKYPAIIVACLFIFQFSSFAQLVANAGPDIDLCEGYSAKIGLPPSGGKPPYKYQWGPTLGLDNPNSESPVVTPTQSVTEYWVKVTDDGGLTNFDTVVVRRHPAPKADAGININTCIGTTVTLGGSPSAYFGTPPFIYKWSFLPANVVNPSSPNPTYIAERVGYSRHVLQVIDSKGCEATSDITVTIIQPVKIDVGNDITICANTPKQIGSYSMATSTNGRITNYRWTPSYGLSTDNIANPTAFPATTTKYYVTALDEKGCQATDSVLVTVKPSMKLTLRNNVELCPDKDIPLTSPGFVTGGIAPYKYKWIVKDENGNVQPSFKDSTVETPVVKASNTRIYEVIVTDAQGCTARGLIQVSVKTASRPTFTIPPELCQEKELTFGIGNASGSYEWLVSGADGQILNGNNKREVTMIWHNSGVSTISVRVMDKETGCEYFGTTTITIKPHPNPIITNQGRSVLCPGESSKLDIGRDYLNVWWSSGPTNTRSIIVNTSGTFTVFVQDSNGCTNRSNPITINVTPKPEPGIQGIQKLCPNTSIQLTTVNTLGTGKFYKTYQWSTGEVTPQITVSKAGAYTVTVTDSTDCPAISPIHTVVDNPLQVETTTTSFLDLETEFDYPTKTVWYKNTDDEDLVLTNYAFISPLVIPELTVQSIDIDGRPVPVNNIAGNVLKVGQKLNFVLKYVPMIPDSVTYSIVLNVSAPCTTYDPVTIPIRAESYDKRMTSIASVTDVTAPVGAYDVHIPLMIKFINAEDSVINASLEAKVRINARLFDPRYITNGTILSHDTTSDFWHVLWIRFDNVTIRDTDPIKLTDIVGTTLATTFFQDSMFLDKIVWDPNTVVKVPRVRLTNGILKLAEYCFPRNVVISNQEKTQISINPNPSSELVKLHVNTNITGEYKVELYAADGAKILTKKVNIEKGSTIVNLDATNYANGIYPVVVSTPTHVEILNLVIDK